MRPASALLIVMIVSGAACAGESHAQVPGEVRIAALLPLTGELAPLGAQLNHAVRLAVADFNAYLEEGGAEWWLGRISVDTGTDPALALEKVRALHTLGIDIVVGPAGSAQLASILSHMDDNNMVAVSPASTAPALAIPGDSAFRTVPDDSLQGRALGALLEDVGMEVAVPIWTENTYGNGLVAAAIEEFEARGGAVHAGVGYEPGSGVLRATVAELAGAVSEAVQVYGADKTAVLIIGFEGAEPVLRAAAAHDILDEVRWFGDGAAAPSGAAIPEGTAARFAADVELAALRLHLDAGDRAPSVDEHIQERLGIAPAGFAYAAYDAVWMIGLSVLESGSSDPADIRGIMRGVAASYSGGALKSAALNEAGDLASASYGVWSVGESGWERKATISVSHDTAPDVPPQDVSGHIPPGDTAYGQEAEAGLPAALASKHADEKGFMLALINAERAEAGLGLVTLGDNPAAQAHADDMIQNCYFSHWGLDGLKPYMRYSLAGGYQSNAENVSGLNHCIGPGDGFAAISTYDYIGNIMRGFMDSPGHRDNILDPHHSSVSLGLAWDSHNIAAVQHFEYDYISFHRPPGISGGILSLAGTAQNGAGFPSRDDLGIQVRYDPPPHNLTGGQVARTYCYDAGTPVALVRPPLPANYRYTDDTYTMTATHCPDPYGVPEDAPAPSSYQEAHELHGLVSSQRVPSTSYEVRWYDALEWVVDGGDLEVSADISEALLQYGPGVYTVVVWGVVDGESVTISRYSIFHHTGP